MPTGWTAVLRGGGFTIDGVESDGSTATKVTLNVTVPADAAEGTQRITVRGTIAGASTTLPVDIRVAPNAAGDISLTTDIPQLKGASDATFPFSLTLTNDTPEDLPFSVAATGPAGWTVTAQVGTQAQAASVVVKAGSTSTVTVSAKASEGTAAGSYPITVDATSGSRSAHADLAVEITGSYKLALTTADGRLNLSATAGTVSDMTLTLTEHRDRRRRGRRHERQPRRPAGRSSSTRQRHRPGRPGGPGRRPRDAVVRCDRRRLRHDIQGDRAGRQRLRPMSG